jgi:hypothetical protein
MKSDIRRVLISITAIALALTIVTSCSGGGGCGGCGGGDILTPIPGGYPGPLTNNLGLARVSKNAITFLQTNLQKIIQQFIPEIAFGIPEFTWKGGIGSWDIITARVCGGSPCNDSVSPKCKPDASGRPLAPQAECCVCAYIDQVNLSPVAPNIINAAAKLSAVEKHGYIQWSIWPINYACHLDINVDKTDISAQVTLKNEATTQRLTFDVGSITYNLSPSMVSIYDHWYCDLADWDVLKGLIIDIVKGQINIQQILDDALNAIKCAPCESDADCPSTRTPGVHCDLTAKQCRNSSNQCVPIALGVEGEIDIGSLLSSIVPGMSAKVQMAAEVGGTGAQYVSEQGLNVTLMGEANSERNICVPETKAPVSSGATLTLGNSAPLCIRCDSDSAACPPDSTCDVAHYQCRKADGTCPTVDFMAGIGINEYLVSKVLWSAFNSGALCLDIGSTNIPALADYLTAATLSIFIPEMKDNLNGNSPVLISLHPQKAPVLQLGAGIVKKGDKNIELAKPLITLKLEQVVLDFYVVYYERVNRIFRVTTDITLPLALDISPDPSKPQTIDILPVIGGLDNLMTNTVVSDYEVLANPPDIMGLVSSLISQLLPSLLKPIAIDLSSLPGVSLELLQIKGEVPFTPPKPINCNDTDDNPATACDYQFLSIYANLGVLPTNLRAPVTQAEYVSMKIPPVEKIRLMGTRNGEIPEITLKVAGDLPNLEFSYRIDNGLWSSYARGPVLTASSPVLAIPGKHEIEVRSRVFNQPMTTDMTGTRVSVVVDYMPPEIRFQKSAAGVAVVANDGVSKEKVKVFWRSGEGLWNEIPNGALLPSGLKGRVEVRAVDEAGIEAKAHTSFKADDTSVTQPSENGNTGVSTGASVSGGQGGWSCSTASVDETAGSMAGMLAFLGMAIALVLRKR